MCARSPVLTAGVWPSSRALTACTPRLRLGSTGAREITALRDGQPCANRALIACNGIAGSMGLCASCAPTRTRPRDKDDGRQRFAKAEAAKRRSLFELLELGLPVNGCLKSGGRLAFDMLNSEHQDVTTGRRDWVITLDLAEADDAHREKIRTEMGEPYRTLLGHLRQRNRPLVRTDSLPRRLNRPRALPPLVRRRTRRLPGGDGSPLPARPP